jgi:type I restriction enzyme S subunit
MFVEGIDKENLPEGWRKGTLGEVGEIIGGATPSTNNPLFWSDNGISWLSPADLSKGEFKFVSKGSKDITELGYKSCSTKMLPKGSILFSSRAPIGLMAITVDELCTNQGFKSIIPKECIGTEYVYYYLHSIKNRIIEENTGSTFDEVSGQSMKEYIAIIPPESLTSRFSMLLKPVLHLQFIKEQENKKLTELQSLLLAKMGR